MKIYETMERKRQFMRIFIEFTEYLFATNCLFFFKYQMRIKKSIHTINYMHVIWKIYAFALSKMEINKSST